jgi:uncharacterized protein Yka (UPF0111/DUF47 family)
MSLAESFLNTAKELLTMTENIKRMESRIDKLTEESRSLDRRLMRIEVIIDVAKQTTRKGGQKELS